MFLELPNHRAVVTLFIPDEEVRQLFSMKEAYDAMHECFAIAGRDSVMQPPRLVMDYPGGWLRLQAGAMPQKGYFGFKAYGGTKPYGVRYVVFLYSMVTGEMLSIIDADTLTVNRTGAHSGVATQYLARKDARTLGVLGSGAQAKSLVEAVAYVRKLEEVRVYSREEANRNRFATEVASKLGVKVVTVRTPAEAVKGCDVVGSATSHMTPDPIISGDWFEEGSHINAIGAVGRGRAEIDQKTFSRSSLVVVDAMEECLQGAQELIDAIQAGVVRKEDLVELSEVVVGKKKGRTSPRQVTLFKSQGSGWQDVASAVRIYEQALKKGMGKEVGVVGPPMRAPK